MSSILKSISDFFAFLADRQEQIVELFIEHIELATFAVSIAILIGVPIGILISRYKKLHKPVMGFANLVQAVPSIALLGFLIPFLGIGFVPAIFAVVLYAIMPIIKNTSTGLLNINKETIEAAKGIGMTDLQILFRVQFPMALPVIMAGVRISAVTAVGLLTLASYIGAGGLGYLIYSGVQMVSSNMILAGAIPACALALLIDFLFSKIEKAVVPISLRVGIPLPDSKDGLVKLRGQRRRFLSTVAAVMSVIILFVVVGDYIKLPFGGAKDDNGGLVVDPNIPPVITVTSKNYTEQTLLGAMAADLIEYNTELEVDRKLNMGGTLICFEALKANEVQVMVEYTSSMYAGVLGKTELIRDAEEIERIVVSEYDELHDLTVLADFGFNNTYALAVRADTAEQYNLETISDLAAVSGELKLGSPNEFTNRNDGLVGLNEAYGWEFEEVVITEGGLRYQAIHNGDVDAIIAYTTDSLVHEYDLVLLEDDLNFFLPYHAVPIVRDDVLAAYPQVGEALSVLDNKLTEEIMAELNYRVDVLEEDPLAVARDFLSTNGYIDLTGESDGNASDIPPVITVASKNYTEQTLLGALAADLIEFNTDLEVDRKLNLGGTMICFTALKENEVQVMVEYTSSMYAGVLGKTELIRDAEEIERIVVSEYDELHDLTVLADFGFNNTYALAVRADTAEQYNLETISDLAAVSGELKLGSPNEFTNRNDGLVGLNEAYGWEFEEVVITEGGLRYQAIHNGDVDAIIAYTTDSLVHEYDLVLLEDDLNFFLPYHAVPIVRDDVLAAYPEIGEVLSVLDNKLTEEIMAELNYKVDVLEQDPQSVAREFLVENGYITIDE